MGDDFRTPGPGCGKCGSPRPGPGGLPLALRLSEMLGISVCASEEGCAGQGPVTLVTDPNRAARTARMKPGAPCLDAAACAEAGTPKRACCDCPAN